MHQHHFTYRVETLRITKPDEFSRIHPHIVKLKNSNVYSSPICNFLDDNATVFSKIDSVLKVGFSSQVAGQTRRS